MPLHVLIVDDSPAMRAFIRRVLDLSGLDVERYVEASNGAEALERLAHDWLDVVLTDINMPVMGGEELLQRMSRHPVLRLIPAIVVSTDRTDSRIQSMLNLGAKGYVGKPFRPETLRHEMERCLEVGRGTE
jgi:two-component system chemotaxis response regulator CheY